jgi:tetratricopeptide (TPR) repeat protein
MFVLMLAFTSSVFASGSEEESPKKDDTDKKKQAIEVYNVGVMLTEKARIEGQKADSTFAFNYRATSSAKAKREYEKAVKKFEQAIEFDPTMVAAFSNLGYCLRKIGKLDQSLAAYHKALKLDPKYAQAREYLGETYLAMDDLDKANGELKFLSEMKSPYADTLAQSIDIYKLKQLNSKMNQGN